MSSQKKIEFLFSCSTEKFIELYKTHDQTSREKFYLKLSTKIVNSIIKSDDVNNLKQHLKLIDLIKDFVDEETWENFNKIVEKSLKNLNYIILACKYNREKVLEYILENTNIVTGKRDSNIYKCFQLEDRDDENHNAFYYAIRVGNCKIIEALLNFSSLQCQKNLDKVYELFAQTYEEFKLKNIVLLDEVVTFVEKKLIDFRFYNSEKVKNIKISHSDIKARIELLVENIHLLTSEYSITNKLDEKFFLRARFIVQNINILKRQMKSTYSKLPWEEVEFCLIAYINAEQRSEKTKIRIFNFFLSKNKLFYYLDIFAEKLNNQKMNLHEISINKLVSLPKDKREEKIYDIINENSEFKELYDHYRLLRDTYSLSIIMEYLDLSFLVDASEKEGQLVITRTLQVIGEYIKNTWESPKMSESTSQLLISSLPPNTREIIIDLRNSLSHNNCLSQRLNIENTRSNNISNFFTNIQNDTKIINTVIKNILHKTQFHHTVTILKNIASSPSANDIKNVLETFDFEINSFWFKDKLKFTEENSLEKLIEKLENIITNKGPVKNLFLQLKQESKSLYSSTNELNYEMKLLLLKEMRRRINDNIDDNNTREIKYFANRALLTLEPNVDFKMCQEIIVAILFQIIGSLDRSTISSGDFDRLTQIINTIFTQIGFGVYNMKWLEELRDNLYKNNYSSHQNHKNHLDVSKENKNSSNKTTVKHEYTVKLSTLKSIIESNQLYKDLSAYQKNKKLQAVIEMLLLDIMSILDSSKNILVDNHLLLDKPSPLLIGKNLRNHLAHGNTLVDISLFDSSIAIFLNAAKLTTENLIESNKTVGRMIESNLTELKTKYDLDLTTIINQEAMFESLERGDFDALKDTLAKGADIHSRNYRLLTALHFAVKGSNCETIKFILDQKVNVDVKDFDGQSPLHVAAEHGRTDVVKIFVAKKILTPDLVNNYGDTPLHIAAQRGHREIVEILLQNNSNAKILNYSGYMPLHCAALNGHKDVVDVLLKKEKGVDYSKSFDGMTILHLAAKHGHTDLVKYLITLKANVNTKTGRNEVPLHEASLNGHLEVVKILIANKADINIANVDGLTPLHNAVETNREEITEVLLKHGAAVNAVYDPDNYAAINHAAKSGHINILKILLKHNADVNVFTNRKMTPLHFAALHSCVEVVDFLIKNKARLNVKDINGLTPLHFACIKGKDQIVKLLLNSGASLDVKDQEHQTPLHLAAIYGQIEVTKVLIEEGANCYAKDINHDTALSLSSVHGHTDVVKLLIDKNIQIDAKNSHGMTSLYQAASCGHEKIVKILKEAGANINSTDSQGNSVLHVSAFRGHTKVVEYLINANIETNTTDVNGMTPLHIATQANCYEIVEILLKKCPSVNIKDKQGRTSLMIASRFNHVKIVKLLIKHGANVKAGSIEPIVIATVSGNKSIVDILLNHENINVNGLIPDRTINLLHLAIESNHNHIVETLIAHKANVNAKSLNGPPIILAAEKGYADIVDTLLKNNADPDIKDDDNRSAIEFAVAKGHLEVVKILFGYTKMKINNKGIDNFTMLHIASQEGYLDIVKYLVEKGADVHATNKSGSKPIHIAAREGHVSIVEFFFSIKMSNNTLGHQGQTLLHYAVVAPKKEIVEYLINQKMDVNVGDAKGLTPIYYAVKCGKQEIIELLLNNGAAFDCLLLRVHEVFAYPPILKMLNAINTLFDASIYNHPDKCKELISQGVIVNVINKEYFSPLHYASRNGYSEIVNTLLKNNANANIASAKGSTPLHFAAKFEQLEIVKILLSNGAIFDARTKKNNRPVDLIKNQDIVKVFKLIEKLFMLVETHDTSLVKELRKIETSDLKMIMNARNKQNETLIVAATNRNFPQIIDLKFGFQKNDFSRKILKANKLSEQGKHSEALIIFEEIFDTQKTILGSDNPGTLDIQLLMAQSHCSQNNYEKALIVYQEVYNKQIKILGFNNKDILKTRSMMGLVLYRLGRNEEAIKIYEDTLKKQKAILDPDDDNLLYTQSHIALVLMGLTRFDEALKMNYEVLEKYKTKFGSNDPTVLRALNNIAMVLTHQGKYEQALKIYQDVYESRKKILRPNHSDTLRALFNKVEVFGLQKNYEQAVTLCEKILKIQNKVLGPDHLDTLNSQCKLGHLFFDQHKFIDALKIYENVYGCMKKVLGSNHPNVFDVSKRIQIITLVLKSGGDLNLLRSIQKNKAF
ncbi:uncharacterized protein LOC123261929 [Cotesia glomerata]|uniref:uncharacterized protein LOC123261929 n=1 Tax=Cotesia glomerata TaxID=32391 RepID=UPI001D02914E|nr:uncharacterized protein LOC123261929 [Cotesia glomerata]